MQENKKKNKEKEPGIIDTVRKVNEKEQREHEEQLRSQKKKEEKQREQYEQVLAEEKVEILKLRQGVISDSDKLDLRPDEKKNYTLWQKFKNFLYHSKWWLGIASFFVLVAGFLIYDSLTSVKTDINIMLLSDNVELYYCYDNMTEFLNGCIDDYNEDGKKYANILYIPISENYDTQVGLGGAYDTNLTKLSSEFQMGESMLLIADSQTDELIMPETTLENLESLYPDCPYTDGCRLYLKDTKFAGLIGFEGEIPDDLYIGVRKVTNTISSEEDTQLHYDLAMETLEKIIDEIC
ncbi:MAG: hypothetical protein ACI4I9_02935 [Porcipelethomonas sp.]